MAAHEAYKALTSAGYDIAKNDYYDYLWDVWTADRINEYLPECVTDEELIKLAEGLEG